MDKRSRGCALGPVYAAYGLLVCGLPGHALEKPNVAPVSQQRTLNSATMSGPMYTPWFLFEASLRQRGHAKQERIMPQAHSEALRTSAAQVRPPIFGHGCSPWVWNRSWVSLPTNVQSRSPKTDSHKETEDIYIYIYIHAHVHTYTHMCMHICTHICTYICIYTYIYT